MLVIQWNHCLLQNRIRHEQWIKWIILYSYKYSLYHRYFLVVEEWIDTLKYRNRCLKWNHLIPADGVSEKVYFLYRRENEPELITEHLPFLLQEWCQIKLGSSGVFSPCFTRWHWKPAQPHGPDSVSDTHRSEQSAAATDFVREEWTGGRVKVNMFRAQNSKSF